MNAAEARKILKPPLKFGDDTQIRARQALERILIAKEFIINCTLCQHFKYTFSHRGADKVEHLENFEEEILECEECRAKIRETSGLHIDEVLAAVAELFEEWWTR